MSPLYLGTPGSLVTFPNLGRDYARPLQRVGGVHRLADGSLVEDVVGYFTRHQISGRWISHDEVSLLDELFTLGGPYALIDPSQRNHLSINQSSGTEERADAKGFSISAGTSITSSTAQAHRGLRSAAWAYGSGIGSNQSLRLSTGGTFNADDPLWGIPVVAGLVYSFSAYLRLNSSSANFTPRLEWYTSAGSAVSQDNGSSISVGGSFVRALCENKTAPATAAYVWPVVRNDANPGSGNTLYLDSPQLNLGATALAYVLGRGIPRCLFDGDLEDVVPLVSRHQLAAVLRQAIAW